MKDQHKIDEYLIRLLNNEISESDFIQLKEWIANNPNAIHYYCMFLSDYVTVRRQVELGFDIQDDMLADPEILTVLAEYEKIAPAIEVPKKASQRELIQKVVYPPREKRNVSKFNILLLTMNAAAIFFLVLFISFAPLKGGIEVATLTDSIDVKWADANNTIKNGARLYSGKTSYVLREGLVKLKFDNNTQVTIEGPADFHILDDDMIKLNYGQLYSQVPPEAYGFQICTRYAKIIDMGTEFGVKEGIDANTKVHVFKGQVNLISNILSKKINIDMLAGSARELNSATGELKEIPIENNLFARQIDSTTDFIWRGQNSLNLADIVGGGNGLGTGAIGKGISLTHGSSVSDFNWTARQGKKGYLNVSELPFIDGVVVPDSEDGTLQVSSQGHIFRECPNTSGLYFDEIRNGGLIRITDAKSTVPMLFDNEQYGTSEKPLLFMHANAGITFNLNAIRDSLSGISVTAFHSRCFLFAKPNMTKINKNDIFVLVDGEAKFKKIGFDQYGVVLNIDIPLTEGDHYLTLIAADGGDSIVLDWVGFAEPCLLFEANR
ncbi:MAG: FecR domain-containing protein [Sedimentisphaerales bacterium]|nr:FecR domain-containing protein [Sedimentisphaerales bacterium]